MPPRQTETGMPRTKRGAPDRPAILTCLTHREQAVASDDGEVSYRGGCVIEIDQQRHRRARGDLHHRELNFLRSLCFGFGTTARQLRQAARGDFVSLSAD